MTSYKYNSTLAGFFVVFNKIVDFFSMVLLYIISHILGEKPYKYIAKGLFL